MTINQIFIMKSEEVALLLTKYQEDLLVRSSVSFSTNTFLAGEIIVRLRQ